MIPENTHAKALRAKLKSGAITCGGFLQINSSIAAEIMGLAGFDWLIVDLEHAPIDFSSLVQQFQAIECGRSSVPFVRAPSSDMTTIKRILDTGARGILVPSVNSKIEAQAVVDACLYPPEGQRGAAKSPRAALYGSAGADYFDNANQSLVIMVSVETREALNNLDDILAIPRIDGIFIGPMDLAVSMGFLRNSREVAAAIEIIEAKVLASDKFLGTIATDWPRAQQLYERGYQWLILMQDGLSLSAQAHNTVRLFREKTAQLSPTFYAADK
ncbi:MAG: 2,4-dihydroxyhept-2-ene-1,7-dioic acid aldolase [Hyphomonadaceae bacterium]|nr:2,4-dihydroxyhept-2-ene-1,7-dioic acid aldolase [Hyphomonadaceae bacterium]